MSRRTKATEAAAVVAFLEGLEPAERADLRAAMRRGPRAVARVAAELGRPIDEKKLEGTAAILLPVLASVPDDDLAPIRRALESSRPGVELAELLNQREGLAAALARVLAMTPRQLIQTVPYLL